MDAGRLSTFVIHVPLHGLLRVDRAIRIVRPSCAIALGSLHGVHCTILGRIHGKSGFHCIHTMRIIIHRFRCGSVTTAHMVSECIQWE
jgi:hypothetical protein